MGRSRLSGYALSQLAEEPGTLFFADGFESGDFSQWTGSTGTSTAISTDSTPDGTFYMRSALANGNANDNGRYKEIGTAGNVSTQFTHGFIQFKTSIDTFTGDWPASNQQKVAIAQYYRASDGSFSNAFRKYQVLIGVAAESLGQVGQYYVNFIEWDPDNSGAFVQGANVFQNSTTYGPANAFDYWDTLRLEIQLDTNGDGTLGSGHGNGIVRLWRNDELILAHTDLSIVNGDTGLGLGRFLLSSTSAGSTWQGSASGQYWDAIQIASTADLLDAMPSAPEVRIANDNPDGWPAATSTYISHDFNTEVSGDMWTFAQGVVAHEYLATGGYGGTGCWKATPTPNGASGDNEDNAGWSAGDGDEFPNGGVDVMTYSFLLYMTAEILDDIASQPSGFWGHMNKMIDVFMAESGSSVVGDGATRQVVGVMNETGGPKFSLVSGGAGTHWSNDSINTNPDLRTLADTWFWVSFVFTTDGTFIYLKEEGDSGVTTILRRLDTDNSGGDGPLYTYNAFGFTNCKNGGGPAASVFGYWDDIKGANDTARFVKMDRLRIANGWIDPPF